jgi:hypothetical protein
MAAVVSRTLVVAVALVSIFVVFPAFAGPFEVNDATWEGGSELYEIAKTELGPERVKAVSTLDWSALRADDAVLVLHPTQALDAGEASDFMKQGGRLAIVDDFGRGDEILHRFKIERTNIPARPVGMLRNNPQLPIAEPWIDPKHPGSSPHPVVANVKRLVLNHPSALTHPDLSSVLMVRIIGEEPAIVAVAGQVGKGRLLAMSDPSALINEMLRYPGNRAFAAGLVRYLAGADEHSQARLYILTNKFGEEGSVGGEKTLSKEISQFLQSLADSLSDVQRHGLPKWAFIVLAALLVAIMGVWVARSSGKPYRNPTPRYARPTPLVARGGVAGRFALLAAPTSAKGLVLLELKSAMTEALVERFHLENEPSTAAIVRALRSSRGVPPDLLAEAEAVLRQMQRAEAVILAGGQLRVGREAVASAARVVDEVLHATSFEAAGVPGLGNGELPS